MKSPHLLSFCSLVLFSYGVFAEALVAKNPPSKCKQGDPECTCETQQQVANSCIKVNLDLGATTPWTGSQRCSLKVFADAQSPLVFTPESLYAVMGYTFKRIGNTLAADGITPKEVVFTHPNGEPVYFVFNDGESIARPDPGFHIKMDERLQMVDAEGWACTRNPVYYDLYETDGTVRRFVATDASNERGRLVSIMDCRGKVTTPADLGIDIVYGPDGVRQFLTPSRLADIAVRQDGYDVTVYPLASSPAKNPVNGRYVLPQAAPLETLSVRSANDGKRAVVTLRKGGGDSETYLFDYVRDDWSLTRPSGVEERHSRFIQDAEAARTVEETYSGAAELLSRDEYNYVWQSWGFAATNRVEGFGGIARTTTWEYYTSGNGKGQVRTEIRPTGLKTEYVYDASDRMITRRRSGPDMMTEVTTYSYVSVDASDVVPPVDTRPRTVVKKLNGIECDRTYYVYSPLTNIVERVGTQGAAYGGTNALRTVTGFYPVVPDDIRSGMVRSVRHEDGRFDAYDYSLVTNVWTETVTHLHEQAMDPVSGKTTRDISVTNARGEMLEYRTEAYIGGNWYTISKTMRQHNLQGKVIRSTDLAGRVTTTAWDCCHKIYESKPDGRITTWDYDAEGRMIASSRLIPLDLTNVTWVTTCYAYDGLGRQTATWTTNTTAHIGIPATTTSYDALGRVISRTIPGRGTSYVRYSANGLVVTNIAPNGATSVTRKNSDGDTLSITGTDVTPEFMSRGVLADGTRWSRTVQGETADSPRFTKRYENMLGATVRSEKSGFRGAILASVNTYDNYGRLVSTASDGEPTNEITYDTLGNRVATVTRVASVDSIGAEVSQPPQNEGGEWRKTESYFSYVLRGSDVWAVQTNVVSCSDATIAPLMQSRAERVTGLTASLLSQSLSTDIRGNVSESRVEYNGFETIGINISPAQTGRAESHSRLGVAVRSVSASGVESRSLYDGLGRLSTSVDGRGKITRTEYDAFGRQSARVDADNNRTTYGYNEFGELVAVTNALGDAVVYAYDLRGHKVYEGGTTYPVSYSYDVFGNKVSMTTYRDFAATYTNWGCGIPSAPSGDTTRWLYDEASGSMTNKVYADGNGTKYEYDSHGRLTKRTWARGIDTTYTYDAWGNLTRTDYSDSTPSVAITYDAMGRQSRTVDAAGVTTFAYDVFGSLTNETVVGVAGTNTIERFGDTFGRDAGYALNGVRQSTLGYDPATGRLVTMLVAGCETPFAWSYLDGSDLKSSLVYPNGLTASWTYGNRSELLEVNNASPTGTISRYVYTYDAVGRRIACAKSGSAFTTPDTYDYLYNARSELTNATATVDAAYRYGYAFYDIGNREGSSECGTNFIYAANNLNQYTSLGRGLRAAPQEEFVPQYDLDGNQALVKTATGVWSVTYNGENRPIRWENGDTVITMSFDRMGRRVTKNAQRFVYNGYLQIADVHSTNTTSNYNYYIWDPTEPVATRPLVWLRQAPDTLHQAPLFYTHDGNKNVSEVISFDGTLAAHYEYAPFGALTVSRGTSAAANSFRFSSEYAENDTATVYYNYRHYEPVMGRWLSRDPVGEEDGLNIYVFIDNGLDVDSLGLVKFDSTCDSIKSNCEGEFKDIIDELAKIAAKYIPEKFPDNDIPGESPREKKRRRKEWIAEHKDDPLWKAILDVYDKYGLIEHKKNRDKIFRTIWRTSEAMRKGFGQVKDDFEKGSTIITCCPDKMSGLCDSDDPRFKTSGGYLPYSDAGTFASAYRGKIVVCPSLMGKGGFDKHGGCGCFIMHELMHKYGMRIPREDKPHELAIENAMIEIQRIILGEFSKHVCKGYDVN